MGSRTLKCWVFFTIAVLTLEIFLLGLTPASLLVPQNYEGDQLWELQIIKSLIEGSWFPFAIIKSQNLGFPFGMTMGDYPIPDPFHFLILKGMSLFCSNPFLIYNLYFALGYLLVAWSFLFTAEKLGINFLPSALAALLFTFLPFHFERYTHLSLSAYYQVPLFLLVLISIWDRSASLATRQKSLMVFLGGLSGIYYAFYFALLACLAGVSASWQWRRFKNLFWAGILCGVLVLAVEIALMPYQIYQWKHPTSISFARNPVESEIYGLKLTQIFLPSIHHRWERWAAIKAGYEAFTPNVEGREESLGLIGSLALLFLLAQSLNLRARFNLSNKLSVLALAAVGFGVVTGGGTVLAFLGQSQLRSHNRISIFLGCMALLFLANVLHHWQTQCSRRIFISGCFCLLAVGLWDQTYSGMQFNPQPSQLFQSDQVFAALIEKSSPPTGGNILQLPYMSFPESPAINSMTDYSHFRPYLHARHCRWSYGVMKGTAESAVIEKVSSEPLSIAAIKAMGYTGIYIDRLAYYDSAQAIEDSLSTQLQKPPFVSPDERELYFPLTTKK